ncbi:DNA-binding protein [Chaetomium tenue]|uniref:DNA-binding protein n=1 Tax=Chaetomium tenue TaxID=1854479 RepID=A0ACB7P7Z5_9PEZI|nr:DNA-binding protein [Chaetomium globosum]
MPPPQPEPTPEETDSLPLDHSHILLSSFNSFLTVAIHNILYYRHIYPPSTFLSTKAYNLPVHQNRHPKVCAWIRDAVDAVAAQLATGHVSRVAIVIHAPLEPPLLNPSPSQTQTPPTNSQPPIPSGAVLERWLIDTSHFPTWPSPTSTTTTIAPSSNANSKAMRDFARVLARDARSEEAREGHLGADARNPGLAWPDLDEQLRGALRRMAGVAEGMAPLEGLFGYQGGGGGDGGNGGGGAGSGCSFTVAVELGEEGRAPIGHPQAWIPSEPNLQPKGKGRAVAGEDIGGVRTRPIRAVEAGPLFFECWVEESKAKEVLMKMAEGPD